MPRVLATPLVRFLVPLLQRVASGWREEGEAVGP